MKKYRIVYFVEATGYYECEAKSKDKAIEMANEQFVPDLDNTEIGDAIRIVEVLEKQNDKWVWVKI